MVPKVSLQDFLPILGALQPKIGKNLETRPIWSHLGQKDGIEIFGGRAAKMSKNSWREAFATTGVKFRSEILFPGEKFGNLTNLVAP